jgi:hypothetical protein
MVKAMSIGDLFKKIAGRKSLSDFGKKRGGTIPVGFGIQVECQLSQQTI